MTNPSRLFWALLLPSCFAVTFGSCNDAKIQALESNAATISTPVEDGIGRYQMHSIGDNLFVLDTMTGKHCQKFISPNTGPTVFTEFVSPWASPYKELAE